MFILCVCVCLRIAYHRANVDPCSLATAHILIMLISPLLLFSRAMMCKLWFVCIQLKSVWQLLLLLLLLWPFFQFVQLFYLYKKRRRRSRKKNQQNHRFRDRTLWSRATVTNFLLSTWVSFEQLAQFFCLLLLSSAWPCVCVFRFFLFNHNFYRFRRWICVVLCRMSNRSLSVLCVCVLWCSQFNRANFQPEFK